MRRVSVALVLICSAVVPLYALTTDAFTGTGDLGGSWTDQLGAAERLNNVAQGGQANENVAYNTGQAWGNDYYSQIVVGTTDVSTNIGVTVRAQGTAGSAAYYLLACGANGGNSGVIYKVTSGTSYSSLTDL